MYGNKNGEKKFLSSFIFEVKYRPLENIYHPKGSTKVMEQMDFYRAINYVKDYGVKRHSVVEEVVCVYPGSNKKEILFDTDYGYFLQLFPDESEETDIIKGSDEMKELLNKWIENNKIYLKA